MKWQKLIEIQYEWIQRGSILRVPSRDVRNWYPDPFTDFLIFDPLSKGVYGLMVASGHKSGLIKIVFPEESTIPGHVGLRKNWLVENWQKWVYPNGLVEDVWLRLPVPIEHWSP